MALPAATGPLPVPAPLSSKAVLLLTQDELTPAAKTSEAIADALRRQSRRVFTRDTADLRWMHAQMVRAGDATRLRAWEDVMGAKARLCVECGSADTVLSLDLHWLICPEPFIDALGVNRIVSIWFDDLRTACVCGRANEPRTRSFIEAISHPKVLHAFASPRQAAEAGRLGLRGVVSPLAADAAYLSAGHPVEHRGRVAFLGGPGGSGRPSARILELLACQAGLADLRAATREELRQDPTVLAWVREEPSILPWLEEAWERQEADQTTAAIEQLAAASARYPRALEWIDSRSLLLDAAFLVKDIGRHDRAACVRRLYDAGLADVYGAPWYWEPYGVKSRPSVPFHQLASVYQSYPLHVNASYAIREMAANEKLFEIAACGRAILNLRHAETDALFSVEEVQPFSDLDELETLARELLADPARSAALGARARERVRREHTWDHRLARILPPS